MPSAPNRLLNVSSVAIIGAGPSGLAAAKYLIAERAFERIVIFEQRSRPGGLWDYLEASHKPPSMCLPVPQRSPGYQIGGRRSADKGILTPLYDDLETNIPRGLMGFSDLAWPENSSLFPKHETVEQYLEAYAKDVRPLIRFDTTVRQVKPRSSDARHSAWTVTSSHNGTDGLEDFDAVVAASGHFNVPSLPDFKGLSEWSRQYPESVSHSMLFKNAEEYRDLKVLLIGNGASGVDIASHIASACKWPLLHSQRSESFLLSDPSPSRHIVPDIAELLPETQSIRFVDGHVESNIDRILFCTGYFYSFPYLDLKPPIISDGTHVQNLYQHLFYRPSPTIVFPVLQQRVIPFPMAEAQAAVFARVWSGRLSLPSDKEMKAWEDEQTEKSGGGRNFHILKFPEDADYINMMSDLATSADGDGDTSKKPPRWGEKEYWLRERFPMVKKAYHDLGQERLKIRSLEELGFDYDRWKKEQEVENKSLI